MSSLEPDVPGRVRSGILVNFACVISANLTASILFLGYNELQEQIKMAQNEKKKLQVHRDTFVESIILI